MSKLRQNLKKRFKNRVSYFLKVTSEITQIQEIFRRLNLVYRNRQSEGLNKQQFFENGGGSLKIKITRDKSASLLKYKYNFNH